MKFKTNAKCAGCSATILGAVRALFPDAEMNLDLASPDKLLTILGIPENPVTSALIAKAVSAAGFQATVVKD